MLDKTIKLNMIEAIMLAKQSTNTFSCANKNGYTSTSDSSLTIKLL